MSWSKAGKQAMEMKSVRFPLLLVLALSTAVILCGADQPTIHRGKPRQEGNVWSEGIQCAIPVVQGERLVFRADRGSVSVEPGLPNRLECVVSLTAYSQPAIQARNCLNRYLFKALQIPHGVLLDGQSFCNSGFGPIGARFDIKVPLKFDVDIHTQGGSLRVERLDGKLRAETMGGDIRTGDIRGPVWVSTDAGTIHLGNIGQNLEARTAGGNIEVGNVNGRAILNTSGGEIWAGIIHGPVTAQTGAGNIILQAASGPVEVETAGGQIRLGECGSTVRAETGAGNIQVAGVRGGVSALSAGGSIQLLQAMSSVMAQTEAGQILAQIDASRKSFGPSQLATRVGDIDVFLPPSLPVTIHAAIANSFGHRIISDFPVKLVKQDGAFMLGPVRGQGKLMGGGDALDLNTLMGNILIRRLNPTAMAQMKAFQRDFWTRWRQAEEAQAARLQQLEQIRSKLELRRAGMEKQLEDLNGRLTKQWREQEKPINLQKIQQLQAQLEQQAAQDQALRTQSVHELEQQLEREQVKLQQRIQEMERRLSDQMRQQLKFVQDQEK